MKQEANIFSAGNGFRCSICQQLILQTNEDGIMWDENGKLQGFNPCVHLVYAISWGDDTWGHTFIYVRPDFAEKIVKMIQVDLRQELENEEKTFTEEDISMFLNGKFNWGDDISGTFGCLPIDFPDLLSSSAVIYYDYQWSSGIDMAIEP